MQETILVIGDETCAQTQEKFQALLSSFPHYTIRLCGLDEACKISWLEEPVLVSVLISLDRQDEPKCLGIISSLHALRPELPVIALTQYGEEQLAQKALRMGVYDFLTKPVPIEKLRLSLQHAIMLRHMRNYIDRLERHVAEQIDMSPQERQALMLTQMSSFLIDDRGQIKPLRMLEKEIIASVLRYSNGCVARAARSLGIGRSTLYRKVGTMGIEHHMQRDNQMTRPMMEISLRQHSSGK